MIGFADIELPPHARTADTWSKGFTLEPPDGFVQLVPREVETLTGTGR